MWWNNQVETKQNDIASIVDQPLNGLRIESASRFSAQTIDEPYLETLMTALEPTFADKKLYQRNLENYKSVLETGEIKTPLNLGDEASQLFWGAVPCTPFAIE